VYWAVPADEQTYAALARLREDPPVPALTFIRHLKRMRAIMLDYRNNTGKENGITDMETGHGRTDF
jgi:hypothetical protein